MKNFKLYIVSGGGDEEGEGDVYKMFRLTEIANSRTCLMRFSFLTAPMARLMRIISSCSSACSYN